MCAAYRPSSWLRLAQLEEGAGGGGEVGSKRIPSPREVQPLLNMPLTPAFMDSQVGQQPVPLLLEGVAGPMHIPAQ